MRAVLATVPLLLLLLPVASVANTLGTLRTFQVASCDGDQLHLSCPPNTVVVIKLVHYGRLASKPGLCGHPSDMQRFNNSDCMDRSALKVVIDECGGRQDCRLHTSPKAFGIDPCPGVRKFVEVLYKCRPNVFRNLVVCQGERNRISCENDGKIAIYSASFGVTKHGSVECPQAPGVTVTDCQASFTSEKMINMCQGHSSCELDADANFFNRPCPDDHNAYLKVTYTCVPKKILREKYDQDEMARRQNATEAPSVNRKTLPPGRDAASTPPSGKMAASYYDGVQGDVSYMAPKGRVPAPAPVPVPLPVPTAAGGLEEDCNSTDVHVPMTTSQRHVIGFITEWITAYRYVSDNKEKFILYLTLSVTGGLLVCLLAVIARLYCQRRRARHDAKAVYLERPVHGFGDQLSEIDSEIDLGPATGPGPTILSSGRLSPQYGGQMSFSGRHAGAEQPSYASSGRGTLRHHDDTNPRSLAHGAPNVYYYS